MASTTPGHVALDGIELVIQEDTYSKQLQTPFNPRFSTGDPGLGDLSYFQYLAMEDWSGGSGQEDFIVDNRFSDSDNIDVTTPGELKLAPRVEHLANLNGPQVEHLNRPEIQEDAWPQITEWLGQPVIYNDAVEFDAGGVEFLEVFETEVTQDKTVNHDTSGTIGVVVNEARSEILSISQTQGLPGDTIIVSVKFKNIILTIYDPIYGPLLTPSNLNPFDNGNTDIELEYVLCFGGEDVYKSDKVVKVFRTFNRNLFNIGTVNPHQANVGLAQEVVIDFTVRIPDVSPGIYKLWSGVRFKGAPFVRTAALASSIGTTEAIITTIINVMNAGDSSTNSNVLFFVQSVSEVVVTRKSLYAPQLRASAVLGSKLVGGRVIDGVAYIEVYTKQNNAVDRTLQVSLTAAGISPALPTYMEFVGSNEAIIAAFDNRIFKVDLSTVDLTAAQRFTFIGQVPGDYVVRMELWNQRIYIATFNKVNFTSTLSWTNGIELQGSYAIDGKFWITDLANFNGALFYSGGTHDGKGQVRLYPSEKIIEVEHPIFDSRIRTLNAGRHLYFGHSHGTGVGTVTERGASTWATTNLGDTITNVVWDIEEVGDTVFFFAGNGFYKTAGLYASTGSWESSKIGGNTPLIDKLWNSLSVETTQILAGHKIRVLVRNGALDDSQWFDLGEMTIADGISKEFFFPSNYQSQWTMVRLELSTDDPTTTPIVKRILVKYVPAALTKLQWSFAARATNDLVMLDKSRSQLSGETIASLIWELRTIGRVRFRDKDEQQYDVIITDIKETTPLLDKTKQESLITVELLEA